MKFRSFEIFERVTINTVLDVLFSISFAIIHWSVPVIMKLKASISPKLHLVITTGETDHCDSLEWIRIASLIYKQIEQSTKLVFYQLQRRRKVNTLATISEECPF